ncbi:MAG: Flp pilus assembly protein CpaB [Alphaproteobacteria bacterium]|nr:MAG: Flp pilus assembly protein CpaB [Alphaproteobacteria bacterium]
MIVMATAVVAAGGAGILALRLMSREPETRVVEVSGPQIALERVLVAKRDIPIGTAMNADMVQWQDWPKEAVGRGFVTQDEAPKAREEIAGAIARASLFQGEPIREAKLVRSDRGYMSAILPEGQRAIATTISTETSAGGFILPNDRVDVIMTRRAQTNGSNEFITETILENVRVLAIDQTIEEKDGEPVKVGQTATLQLTPRQAEVLIVAQQMADRLSLALRSLEDSKSPETKAAYHLLVGERGAGTVRVIKYGNVKDVTTGTGVQEGN